MSIYHYTADKVKTSPTLVALEIEPTFISLGPYHLACGMNNHIWFYDLGRSLTDNPIMLGDREYMSEVKQLQLNTDYCAVLCGGQIMLHTVNTIEQFPIYLIVNYILLNFQIDSNISSTTAMSPRDKDPKIFPDEIQGLFDTTITCLSLTNDFLCFGTDVISHNHV